MTNYTNTVLYTGITNNLNRRVSEHKSELFEGFTKKYHVTKLVFFQDFTHAEEAIAAEKKIKGWTRKKKIELIQTINTTWKDLSGKILRYAQDDN